MDQKKAVWLRCRFCNRLQFTCGSSLTTVDETEVEYDMVKPDSSIVVLGVASGLVVEQCRQLLLLCEVSQGGIKRGTSG